MTKKIFPKLIDFVFSIAVCDKAPTYEPPSKERLREALNIVWRKIGESDGRFVEKYIEYSKERSDVSAAGMNLATFICAHFKQNIR